jgi:hypothetical protein
MMLRLSLPRASVRAILAAVAALATPALAGGHSVGNGGDAVICRAAADDAFAGTYALDYLLTYSASADALVPVESLDASFQRLRAQIAAKLPELLQSFDSFRVNYRNTTDLSRTRVWEEAPFGLIDLEDEAIVASLPANCRDGDTAHIVQAVVREWPELSGAPPSHVTYRFVPSVLDDLQKQAPLQLSFLVIHEWLWDLSTNVTRNRRIDRLLHSEALERSTREQLVAQLTALGLYLPGQAPDGFRDDFCAAERGAGAYWNDRADVNGGALAFPGFQLVSRQRDCDSVNGCFNWQDATAHVASSVAPDKMLFFNAPGRFVIESLDAANVLKTHAACQFDDDGAVRCSTFLDRAGKAVRLGPHAANGSTETLDFAGVLGRGCLKLENVFWYAGEMVTPVASDAKFRHEEQTLLYRSLGARP